MSTDPIIDELDKLGVWELHEPTPGFATGVLDETEPRTERRKRPLRWPLVGLLALASAAAAAFAIWPPPQSVRGELASTARQTIELGERAVVVAEPRTELSWQIDAYGNAHIDQRSGSVFYRVDQGPAFVVDTPAGDVEVTGTSFNVEVVAMNDKRTKKRIGGVLTGALASAAVVVTVYEGRVVLANDEGSTAVAAGESAVASDTDKPRRTTPADEAAGGELARLKAETRAQQREIESLRTRLSDSGEEPVAEEATEEAAEEGQKRLLGPGSPVRPDGFAYFEPTQSALDEMARCGVVAWDQPDPSGAAVGRETLEDAGVEKPEAETIRAAEASFQAEKAARLREFYAEAGGSSDVAGSLEPAELLQFVYGRLDRDELVAAREAIAIERAGQGMPPTSDAQTLAGRFMRWEAQLGDEFESSLANDLGADRAYELRAAGNGWQGSRMTFTNKCSDE